MGDLRRPMLYRRSRQSAFIGQDVAAINRSTSISGRMEQPGAWACPYGIVLGSERLPDIDRIMEEDLAGESVDHCTLGVQVSGLDSNTSCIGIDASSDSQNTAQEKLAPTSRSEDATRSITVLTVGMESKGSFDNIYCISAIALMGASG